MSKKPNMDALTELFAQQASFSLTEAQYEARTGARLPKDSYYLIRNSALSKRCKELGFRLRVQEKTVFIDKE